MVNLLQSLSKTVHDFASQKVELAFSNLGSQKVKNTTLHAYDVIIEGLEERVLEVSTAPIKSAESKSPTIAVMPFKNLSNESDNNLEQKKKLIKTPSNPEPMVAVSAITNIFSNCFVTKNAVAPGIISKPIERIIPTEDRAETIVKDNRVSKP